MQIGKYLTTGEITLSLHSQTAPIAANLLDRDEHGITVQLDGLRGLTYFPWTSVERVSFVRTPSGR